ncbi:MAG: TM2 domain-containing protein [Chitinophagaceae bacterium]
MRQSLMVALANAEYDELAYVESVTKDLSDEKLQFFLSIYISRRKKSDTILIGCILGFIAAGGIQRFMLGQIGMGILYLFTGGLCLIGTIVDLVNHKKLTFEYNQNIASETMGMVLAA